MTTTNATIPDQHRRDVEILWDYHNMHHEPRPCDIGIGLGSHDPGVATIAADLYHAGMYPKLVFTGANAPTTVERFPRGEAVHYRELAIGHGVPAEDILVETTSTNTGENVTRTRELLRQQHIGVRSAIVMSRPYQQRRAYATFRKLWPELEVRCAAQALPLDEYVTMIADVDRVINMIVGDTQRIEVFPEFGFAIPQEIPDDARAAYHRLIDAGYTSRLIPGL